jgi:transcriptional antiterminator RfaH
MEVYENKNWYLLQAKPRQHEKAFRNLRSQEYECYSPTVSVIKNQFDVRESRIEPLFPGYIFINLSVDCNWMAISSTRGVNGFVRFGMYPTKISDEVVHGIDMNLSKYGSSIDYSRKLHPGDLVNIESDAFIDFEGIFKCSVGNHRSIVLIKLLEKTNEIIVETKCLKKA